MSEKNFIGVRAGSRHKLLPDRKASIRAKPRRVCRGGRGELLAGVLEGRQDA